MAKKFNTCSLTIVIFLITLSLSCCSDNNRSAAVYKYPHVINIEEGFKNASEIRLSEIADSISYVILSNVDQVPIGGIGKIQLTDNSIYLRERSGLIMRFDRTGKFLNSFGKTGRGPLDYLPGSVYTITPDEKVHIFRSPLDSYLIFDPDGNYVRTRKFKVPRTIFDFTCLSDSAFMCTFLYVGALMKDYMPGEINWSAGIFNPSGNPLQVIEHPLKNAGITKSDIQAVASNAPSLTFFDHRAVIMPKGDTIYEVSADSIFPGYIINWGQVPHKEGNELHFRQAVSSGKTGIGSIILETSYKTFIRVNRGEDTYIFEYDKTTGKTRSMLEDPENSGFINDLDGGINFYPYYTNRAGDIWVIDEDAYSFKQEHSPDFLSQSVSVSPGNKEKLKAFIQKVKDDDNPVLRIVYLKK